MNQIRTPQAAPTIIVLANAAAPMPTETMLDAIRGARACLCLVGGTIVAINLAITRTTRLLI